MEYDVTPKWGEFQTMRISNIKDDLYLNCVEAPYYKREQEDCTIEIKNMQLDVIMKYRSTNKMIWESYLGLSPDYLSSTNSILPLFKVS